MGKESPGRTARKTSLESAAGVLQRHFAGLNTANLITANREYPAPARVDLQRAIDELLPSFSGLIKELMRRAAQFLLESGEADLQPRHIDAALEEMLFDGGSLNAKLLGAAEVAQSC